MGSVTLADAKARLSELVERATQGETVLITRRGKAVAQIAGLSQPRQKVDLAALQRLTKTMTPQPAPAGEWISKIRDDERY
jgi:prevent-host-death family protein